MAILRGHLAKVGSAIDIHKIPSIPPFRLASVDGYGNLKTTIKKSHLKESVLKSKVLRVTLNGYTHLAINTLLPGNEGKIYDLCLLQGSSGGKKANYLEIVRLMARACDDFKIEGPRDDLGRIEIEPVRV